MVLREWQQQDVVVGIKSLQASTPWGKSGKHASTDMGQPHIKPNRPMNCGYR